MAANDMQVGGDHYKTKYEHWDLVILHQVPYLEACATKYIARWRKKDGYNDLRKARHYVEKLLEAKRKGVIQCGAGVPLQDLTPFYEANDVPMLDAMAMNILFKWRSPEDLEHVISIISKLLATQTHNTVEVLTGVKHDQYTRPGHEFHRPGTPEDGGHHGSSGAPGAKII